LEEKTTIDGVEYIVSSAPPYLTFHMVVLAETLKAKPQTLEEAAKNMETVKKCFETILSETVKPTPSPQHYRKLFNKVVELTEKELGETENFLQTSS